MESLLAGLGLGLGSGVAPGPLLALVIAATLRGGLPAGLRVSIAPLITDLPIVVLSVLALGRVPPDWLPAIGVLGGLVVCWFGIESLREARRADPTTLADGSMSGRDAVVRGALVNLTNPAPWLFWLTAGSSLLVAAYRTSPVAAAAFLAGFYLMLIGSKAVVAWGIAAGRHLLTAARYRVLLAATGAILLALGITMVIQAVAASR